jgi:hypothetical protein
MSEFGKTYGEQMLEEAIRQQRYAAIRRLLCVALALSATASLSWMAFFK